MLKRIGTSFIPIKNAQIPQGKSFMGPTGPTGSTGSTGPTGPTGNTGNIGTGIYYIQYINSDGITVYLTDGSAIEITGISGNPPSTQDSYEYLKLKLNVANIGATTNNAYLWPGQGVFPGFTAYFNTFNITGNGLTAYYSGNDIVFAGITLNYSIGPTGSVLAAFGNTGNALLDSTNKPLFRYQEITIGSTTESIASGILNAFYQGKNKTGITNINLTQISGVTAWIKNPWNTSIQVFGISGNTWSNTQYYHSDYFAATGNQSTEGITNIVSNIFNIANVTNFGFRKLGSCCYCDTLGLKNCIDYTTEQYCLDVLSGSFNRTSCTDRRSSTDDASKCDDYGACCVNGQCYDTVRSVCSRLGGAFDRTITCLSRGAFCS